MTTKQDWMIRAGYLRDMADGMKAKAVALLLDAEGLLRTAQQCDDEAMRLHIDADS